MAREFTRAKDGEKMLPRLTFPAIYAGQTVQPYDSGETGIVIGSNGDHAGPYGEPRVVVEFADGERVAYGRDEFERVRAPRAVWSGGHNTDYSGAFPTE